MSSNLVCNHTQTPARTPITRSSDFVDHSYHYRQNWTPLSPVTITNCVSSKMLEFDWFLTADVCSLSVVTPKLSDLTCLIMRSL